MKKIILLPILGIVAISLWSFRPAPQATNIITGEHGEAIIPSTCSISEEDKNFILTTIQAYGPDYGYLNYTSSDGVVTHFGNYFGDPVDPLALHWVDATYPGADLEACRPFTGYVLVQNRQSKSYPGGGLFDTYKNTSLSDLWNQIGPVLQKYGYEAR